MSFQYWVKYLKAISLFFSLQGLLWAIWGSFDPVGMYDSLMARAFFNTEQLPGDAQTVLRFILVPFGATTSGYFVLQYLIATYAFARKERWAYQAIFGAFMLWFTVDTTFSLYLMAYFNVLLANLPALLLMLPVLVGSRKFFKSMPNKV